MLLLSQSLSPLSRTLISRMLSSQSLLYVYVLQLLLFSICVCLCLILDHFFISVCINLIISSTMYNLLFKLYNKFAIAIIILFISRIIFHPFLDLPSHFYNLLLLTHILTPFISLNTLNVLILCRPDKSSDDERSDGTNL